MEISLVLRNPRKEVDPMWSERRLDYKNVEILTPTASWQERSLKLKQCNGSTKNI